MKFNKFLTTVVFVPVALALFLPPMPVSTQTTILPTQQENSQSDDSGDGSRPKPPAIKAEIHAVIVTPTPTPVPTVIPTPVPTPTPIANTLSGYVAPAQVKEMIVKWAIHYGVDANTLVRIADCESDFNPSIVNYKYFAGGGNPTGIFQYLPDTWRDFSTRAGLSGASIWDPEAQAQVTAWAFANGLSGHWECR